MKFRIISILSQDGQEGKRFADWLTIHEAPLQSGMRLLLYKIDI